MAKRGRKSAATPSARYQLVLDALEAGSTLKVAGSLIGVTVERARQIACRWGCDARSRSYEKLSKNELVRAIDLCGNGMPIQHIACTLKRDPGTVTDGLIRLGLHKPRAREDFQQGWSKADAADLVRSRKRGEGFASIAKRLNRNIGMVLGKAARLGLCKQRGVLPRGECEVDERGWRVPAAGTQSRNIYDLMLLDLSPSQIKERNPHCSNVYAVMHAIKQPQKILRFKTAARSHAKHNYWDQSRQATLDATREQG